MDALKAILVFGMGMAAIALVGSLTLTLKESTLKRIILPLVAFASGSLIGGALFHMIPAAVEKMDDTFDVFLWVAAGFVVFLVLEQLLHWHHCHRTVSEHRRPIGYLILIADGLHNLIGGLSIGALFIADFRLGLTAWFAAVAHEIPQELGDFGVLVHGGWKKRQALLFNLLSGLTFPAGGLIAYMVSTRIDVDFLIPFAAGNFLYIGAVDLIPEFKETDGGRPNLVATLAWLAGMAVLLAVRLMLHHHH
jgi:zinc and cadmium transporter